jgi:type II secretory pathway predicted ATPase ExeA
MWKRHWKLWRDPFAGPGTPYVPLSAHEEAVARLVDTVETGQRGAVLRAGDGLGKSVVLARALAETRGPSRRAVLLSGPGDGAGMLASLAEGLGRRVPPGAGRGPCWKALDEAVRLCRWQRLGVVLAVDDCQHLTDPSDRLDLERLTHLDPHPETRLTVLLAFRTVEDDGSSPAAPPWELRVRLPALTRGDAEVYLGVKLAAAGRDVPTFTPRAIQRLHAASGGNPRGLDRLASLALRAGALRGLEIVTPDVIEGVARECTPDRSLARS